MRFEGFGGNGSRNRSPKEARRLRETGDSIGSQKIAQLRDRQSKLEIRRADILGGLHAGLKSWSEFHEVCAEIAKIDVRLRSMGKPRKRLRRELLWVNKAENPLSRRRE